MKGEWCYFKSYFTPAQCSQILQSAQALPAADAVVGIADGSRVDTTTRRSQIRWALPDNSDFKWVFRELWDMAIQANRDFFDFHISKLDYIQIAEYDSAYKGEYKVHHDVFWLNGDPSYHRKLSCIIQLTDPSEYEGGSFELVDTNTFPPAAEIATQGTVIFFPSFFLHRANPVTAGVRHSVAAWFDGPKWR
jgi:PKHD-type hydroxylase